MTAKFTYFNYRLATLTHPAQIAEIDAKTIPSLNSSSFEYPSISTSFNEGSAFTLEIPISTIPPKANNIAMLSKTEILSLRRKKLRKTVMNIYELNTTKNIPSGISIGEIAKKKKEQVPARHLRNSVNRRSFGTELKNYSSNVSFMSNAEDTILNAERKKANS